MDNGARLLRLREDVNDVFQFIDNLFYVGSHNGRCIKVPATHIGEVALTLRDHEDIALFSGAKWVGSAETAMRIQFENTARPKAVAKSMITAMSYLDPLMKLSRAQDLTAFLYGYDDWHELTKSVGKKDASLDDTQVTEGEASERKSYQIERLTSRGVAAERARYLIEALHPSSVAPCKHKSREEFINHLSILLFPHGGDGFTLICEGPEMGELSFRSNGFYSLFPFHRRDLAEQVKPLFSTLAGHHPADRISVSAPVPFVRWRTQWYGHDWYSDERMPESLLGRAFFKEGGWGEADVFFSMRAVRDPAEPRRRLKEFMRLIQAVKTP